ncbi:hypothetical protein JNM87_00245 [Candidatus Saccharibacteria bacterium]|nr:hypothetical protein [Candidatus Saccharibacteria bacterium]
MKRLTINLPEYIIDTEPDINGISKAIDNVLKQEFMGKSVVVRGIASSAHPAKSTSELIDIICQTGTDRYDPSRVGDRYENVQNKHIDLFGVPAFVSETSEISRVIIWGFYHSSKALHGQPVKIDVVIIYDAEMLSQVQHSYAGRDDVKDDGFAFKHPNHKVDALLGILRIC